MNKKSKIIAISLLSLAAIALVAVYVHGHTISVLQPAGEVGTKERNLIIFATSLSLLVVVPVFTMLGMFAWKYRESNTKARYSPELGGSKLAESVWWLVPTLLITIISVVTWRSSYALDPFKPLASTHKTLHVQVVALDWKWLFIYPGANVASVNEVVLPVDTPVDFQITSDAVMTSFWIPQLGGQMYAMTGMSTQLNLMAAKPGDYRGVAANISGKGFSNMHFTAKAVNQATYNDWLRQAKSAKLDLSGHAYASLAKPSQNNSVRYYSSVTSGLYDNIVMKYMMPMSADMPGVTN